MFNVQSLEVFVKGGFNGFLCLKLIVFCICNYLVFHRDGIKSVEDEASVFDARYLFPRYNKNRERHTGEAFFFIGAKAIIFHLIGFVLQSKLMMTAKNGQGFSCVLLILFHRNNTNFTILNKRLILLTKMCGLYRCGRKRS